MLKKNITVLFFLLLLEQISFSQPPQVNLDSLLTVLKSGVEDTTTVNVLNQIAKGYVYQNPDTARTFAKRALMLSEKIDWKLGAARSHSSLGICYLFLGQNEISISHHTKAIQLFHEAKEKDFTAALFVTASTYVRLGNYPKGLEYNQKALKMAEEVSRNATAEVKERMQHQISGILTSIGNIYYSQGDYSKALEVYFKVLRLDEKAGIQRDIMLDHASIANVYFLQGEFEKALEYYGRSIASAKKENPDHYASILTNMAGVYTKQAQKALNQEQKIGYYNKALSINKAALEIAEEIKNMSLIANVKANIAGIYLEQCDENEDPSRNKELSSLGMPYLKQALELTKQTGEQKLMVVILGNIGDAYSRLGNYKEAEESFLAALDIAYKIGVLENTKDCEIGLSELYTKMGKPVQALDHYKKYIEARDAIFNEENTKKDLRTEMSFEYEKKEAATKEVAAVAAAVAAEESKKQKIIIWSVVAGLFILMVFSVFVVRSLRLTTRQKQTIQEQKHIVEEKHKEITDSILYAKRIQRSLLPTEKYIDKSIKRLWRG